MTVLFEVTHPAHVHLFRNAIRELEDRGEEILVTSRDKDLTIDLLERYDIDHTVLSRRQPGYLSLAAEWTKREFKTLQYYWSADPDIIVSRFNPAASHASFALGIPHIVFDDTEDKPAFVRKSVMPFSDVVYTPECFNIDVGRSHVRYPGYHELAYLHPNRFDPDPSILSDADLDHDERFVILRLVSWDAIHDVGDSGFNNVVDLVETIEETGVSVRITSEADLPSTIEDRQASIPPHRIHHLLAFANLYIGESATMATESAVLGTPAVFVSSNRRGYTDELETEYGLVFNYSGEGRHRNGLEKALEILEDTESEQWERRQRKMLDDKIDTTQFIVEQIAAIRA